TPNVAQQRSAPDENKEQAQADQSIDQVEGNLAIQQWIGLLQLGGGDQREVLVHEDKEADRNNNVDRRDPAADFKFLFGSFAFVVFLEFIQLHVGGKLKGSEAERHCVAEGHNPAKDRPSHPFMFFGEALKRFTMG